jgi:hypothetical protein
MSDSWVDATYVNASPNLVEALERLGDEYGPLGVAIVAATLTDPAVLVQVLGESDPRARRCPDGGACHHSCAAGCYRVRVAGPLTGAFPGDKWPAQVVRTETARDIAAAVKTTFIPDLRNYGPSSAADWMRGKAAEVALREGGLLPMPEDPERG